MTVVSLCFSAMSCSARGGGVIFPIEQVYLLISLADVFMVVAVGHDINRIVTIYTWFPVLNTLGDVMLILFWNMAGRGRSSV